MSLVRRRGGNNEGGERRERVGSGIVRHTTPPMPSRPTPMPEEVEAAALPAAAPLEVLPLDPEALGPVAAAVFGSLAEGIVLRNRTGDLVWTNRRALEILLDNPDALLRGTLVQESGLPLAPEERPGNRTLSTGESYRQVVCGLLHPTGEESWYRENTEAIRNEEGEVIGVVSALTDITRERSALSGLHESLQGIDAIIAERTREITERERLLALQLETDALTGLPNRRKLLHDLQKTPSGALLVIGIDPFLRVFSCLGASMAENLFLAVSRRFSEAFARHGIRLYRFATDKFALLVETNAEASLELYAESCVSLLRKAPFPLAEDSIFLSATVGALSFDTGKIPPRRTLALAESALAKARLRGCGCFIEKNHHLEEEKTPDLWGFIRRAFREDGFLPSFYPVLCHRTNSIPMHFCRFQVAGTEGQPFDPFTTLPLGGHSLLGRQLALTFLSKTTALLPESVGSLMLSLDASILADEKTAAELLSRLEASGSAGRFVLALSGTEEPATREAVTSFVDALHLLGGKICINHVGSSPLDCCFLSRLRPDFFRVDETFLAYVPHDRHAQAAIRALMALAREIGARVIATGVDNTEILDTLSLLGVDYSLGSVAGLPETNLPRIEENPVPDDEEALMPCTD